MKLTEINFESIHSITYVRDAKSAHTLISDLFGVVKFCSLIEEGRRGWEGRVKNGVRMKHRITLESIKFSYC